MSVRSFCDVTFASPFDAVRSRAATISCLSRLLGGHDTCSNCVMPKRFVYVLKNDGSPPKYYTGVTSDVLKRLAIHNAGACIHTAKHAPWRIDLVIEFPDERRAIALERYLKSGSGVAFAQRHLR